MKPKTSQWIARMLIVSMLNPGWLVSPAWARDTDIFSGFYADASTSIKPNILLLLDTSDSMNLPEAWKEYPGAYDSHVEYLWNDLALIVDADSNSAGEVTAADDTRISTAEITSQFYTKWGFWSGKTLTERQTLWQAARNSAKETVTGDPGPKHQWRNYNDLSWIYWLPTGVAETDARLRAPSWNRFRGYIQELGDGAGGSQLRGGPSFSDQNDFRQYNQCGASLNDLTPSTVLVPSSYAKNDGKYLGQQWARWEPYLALTGVGIDNYPGSSTLADALGTGTQYPVGYLDTSTASTGNPATNPVRRDSYPGAAPLGSAGLPIRYNAGSAGAGWDDIKADAGGFVLRQMIDAYTARADLEAVMGTYGMTSVTDVDGSGSVTLADSKFIAWKGNRDAAIAPAFGSMTGVPAYYDQTAATCDSATGPASATCLNKPSGTTTPAFTLTKTATCNLTGTTSETDGSNNTRQRGGSCTIGTISNSGTDSNGTAYPNFSDVPNPTVCPAPTTSNQTIRTIDYANCTRGTTTVSAATTCSLINNQTLTIAACAPTGGNSVSVASCAWSGQSTDTVASCGWSGRSTKTVATCAWSGRSATYTEGVGWFASGGTCSEGGSTTYCSATGGSTGPYATQAQALAATAGCTNSVPAGSYQYGGTCTENGSSDECTISGGTTVLGGGFTNVNATCSNSGSPAAGSYKYGGTCTESGSATSCQITGGTSYTIRGTTRTYNQTCSNKSNSGQNKYQAGSYSYGQTCTGTAPQTCSNGTTATITIRGTNYTQVTSCNSTLAAGTYNRGGSCSGTNVPCQTVTDYGGTTITSGGNTWYSTLRTCTPPSGAQTYFSSCTGRKREMPAYPPGGNAVTTNNTPTACNFTTNTVTINGTNYINYTTCTDKTDVNSTCSARYGANCPTGCGAATPTSVTGGATSQTNNFYRTYNFQAKTDYLVHDCKADDSGTKYMHFNASTLGSFGAAWNSSSSYANDAVGGVAASDARKVDMYSVNYLNWKFGPKGPNGHPIGRKTRLQIAKDVLTDVTGAISGVKIGLMSFNQLEKEIPSGATSGNSSGAHLVKAVKNLDAAHRDALKSSINALTASSATPLTESLYEAYRYFKGQSPVFGGATYQAKEAKNSPRNGSTVYVTEGIDTSSDALTGGNYKSPITDTCQENFVILVSDGAPENDTSADTDILALPDGNGTSINQGGTTGQFVDTNGDPYGPKDPKGPTTGGDYVLLDELANYMSRVDALDSKDGDQVVKVHTVSFGIDAPVLTQAANKGKGNAYAATDAETLKGALEAAIKSVSQWQPVGATPAVTYKQTTGDTGDTFLAMFTPSSNTTWAGTIKKYKYEFGSTLCGVSDCGNPNVCMTGNPSVSYTLAASGASCGKNVELKEYDPVLGVELRKIRQDAVSYWQATTQPDGGTGNKGGTGQVLIGDSARTPATRSFFTFLPGVSTNVALSHASNALAEENMATATPPGNITKTMMGDAGMSDATQVELLRFARGSDGSTLATWRPWPHFDSVHSSPAVDTSEILPKTTPATFRNTVYYLTADGVLHAIDPDTGVERWAFMVPEGLSNIAAVKANTVGQHIEVADASPVLVTTSDDKRLVVFGMRRGGRAYYALDVTTESAPKFAWKIANDQTCNGASCSASSDFSELGYTWSTPVSGYVRGYVDDAGTTTKTDDKLKPVLIFGGGYDPNQDSASAGADAMGRAVFVVDAASGSLVAKFDLTESGVGYSVPADVLALDTTGDAAGTLDRVYVGDMGGRLWRMDLDDRSENNLVSSWKTKKVLLAKLATTSRPNKLFNRPTMGPATFKGQVFDAVFIGGGDLQRPTSTGSNDAGAFFMVKDFAVAGVPTQASTVPNAATTGDFVDMTAATAYTAASATSGTLALDSITEGSAVGSTLAQDLAAATGGYVIKLGTGTLDKGEKVSSHATVMNGIAYFGTYLPSQEASSELSTQCRLGGYGQQYAVDAVTGTPTRNDSGSLLYSSANGRAFGFVSGFGVPLSIVGGPGKGIYLAGPGVEAKKVEAPVARTYWYTVPER